jgi:uncharacterized protein (UPF0548 family)
LIAGEERLRVLQMENDDVLFEAYSFTKGSGLLGAVAMPFIRPLQKWFFEGMATNMVTLMKEHR